MVIRVSKADDIAALTAQLARAIVRKFGGRPMVDEATADLLEDTGFLKSSPPFPDSKMSSSVMHDY